MELPTLRGCLIPPVGGPLALPTGRSSTDRTAVPVAAVATLTDHHLRVTAVTGKEPLSIAHHSSASSVRHNGHSTTAALCNHHPAGNEAASQALLQFFGEQVGAC